MLIPWPGGCSRTAIWWTSWICRRPTASGTFRKPCSSTSRTRDADVVEYALNRTLSPALVAEYQTLLPDKRLLQAKLEEFYEILEQEGES